jgi:hypothetical protein
MSGTYFFNQTSNYFYNYSSPYPSHPCHQYYNNLLQTDPASGYLQPPTPPYDSADSFYFNQKSLDYQAPCQNFGKKKWRTSSNRFQPVCADAQIARMRTGFFEKVFHFKF